VALGAAALAALAPRAASACSVCLAGDPIFSTQGSTSQEAGSFSLYLEARSFRKSSGSSAPAAEDGATAEGDQASGERASRAAAGQPRGKRDGPRSPHASTLRPRHGGHSHGPPPSASQDDGAEDEPAAPVAEASEEDSRGQRLDLFASWTPLDRLTLTLDVPFAWNRIVEREGSERTRSTLSGLGDASLGSSFVLWRNRDVLPSTWLEGRIWLKAPTGRDEAKVDGVRDPHLQPGTGSWDFGAGLAAVHRTSWGSFYGSAFYRENTPGSLDYVYGDVWLANLALEVPLGHAVGEPRLSWLTPGLELNFRYAGYDHEDGERYEDSGGSILYVTPSVRIRLPFGLRGSRASIRAAVQIPLTQSWLHGEQREEEVWSVGLHVPF
jgi:hypothetical protein